MKIIALSAWALFYVAYYIKKLVQHQSGIRTNQMAKGNKAPQTVRVEKAISAVSLLMAAAAPLSVILDLHHTPIQLQIIGVAMAFLGDMMLILGMVTMKNSWRAGIPSEDKTQLITNGIYRFSRNPAFVGFDLFYLGLAIAFPNVIQSILCLSALVIFHLQIRQEEAFLTNTFGKEYTDYCRKVRRYL